LNYHAQVSTLKKTTLVLWILANNSITCFEATKAISAWCLNSWYEWVQQVTGSRVQVIFLHTFPEATSWVGDHVELRGAQLHKNVVLFTGIQVEYRTRLVMGRRAPLERWSFQGKEVVTSSAKFDNGWYYCIHMVWGPVSWGLHEIALFLMDMTLKVFIMSCHGLYKLEVWEIIWKQWVRLNARQFQVIAVLQKGSSFLPASCIL
jgi:hypothetical protein